jgi:phospholipase/lecithinase/hemolysin
MVILTAQHKAGGGMKKAVLASVFALVLWAPLLPVLAGYSSLFVFGDSLSDSGNNAVALAPDITPVPIPMIR